MSLQSYVNKWYAKRKKKQLLKNRKDFVRGFGWAMAAFFVEKMDKEEIKGFIEHSLRTNTYNQFDAGVESALEIIDQVNF